MFSLMSDLRFKTLHLVSSLTSCEQGKVFVEEHDKKIFISYVLKCYYHLHPLIEFKTGVVEQRVEKDRSLDIFEMTSSTSELATELVNKELLIFRHYQVDVKDIKCPLQWREKHESMFPTFGFCARKILGIIESQIETKKIFSLIGILTSPRRCLSNQKIWTN